MRKDRGPANSDGRPETVDHGPESGDSSPFPGLASPGSRLRSDPPSLFSRLPSPVSGLLFSLLAAIVLCAFASIWPVRLDARALQDLSKVQSLSLPQSSGQFVFLSRDNSIESARTATFGLRQLAFPDGSVFWAALKEHCNGPWSGGFAAIDQSGAGFVPTEGAVDDRKWAPAPDQSNEARERITTSHLVYDSPATRALFEQRWPFLKTSERVAVVSDAPAASTFRIRRPANEFTMTRIVRIASVIGSFVSVWLLLIRFPSPARLGGWVVSSVAVFLTLGLNISLTYLIQWFSPGIARWSSAVLWAGLLLAGTFVKHKPLAGVSIWLPWSRTVRLLLVYCVAAYALLFLVRLDFDGDFFNNWLPQARFHYFLGRHDPALILRQGSMQAASYPPGYGIVLSSLMWVSGMRPAESFLMGADSSFAILMYRLFIFALNAALLLMVIFYLRRLSTDQPAVWIACVALTLLLIPTTAGRHFASETVLFPMLAASIVMIAFGQNLESPWLTAIGIGTGGMATLIKWEAGLIFALAVLPWLVSSRAKNKEAASRELIKWAAVLALSLVPVAVWKFTSNIHNEFFAPVTWQRFVSSLHLLPGLAGRAARGMLDDGRLVLFALALPCAVLVKVLNSGSRALPVPLGIASLLIGFVVIFLFANLDSSTYLDTSYSRLVMVPTFGAILYCAEATGTWRAQTAGLQGSSHG